MPAIVDDQGPDEPTTIFESEAILVYLGENDGKLLLANGRARTETFSSGSFGPCRAPGSASAGSQEPRCSQRIPGPALVSSLSEEIARLFTVLDKRLSEVEAGEYSIADVGGSRGYATSTADHEVRLAAARGRHEPMACRHSSPADRSKGIAVPRSAVRPAQRADMSAAVRGRRRLGATRTLN
jgi:glutathione S-transferase